MDPLAEEQKNPQKEKAIKEEKLQNCQKIKGQIDLKNTNLMQNHESQHQQTIRSESIGDLRPFDYSLNSSYSLHSHLSTAQHIEEINPQISEVFQSQGATPLGKNRQEFQNQGPLLQKIQIDIQTHENQSEKGNFMKNKINSDLLDPEIMAKLMNEFKLQEDMEERNIEENKKPYISCLHKIVDKINLQSPKKVLKDSLQQEKQENNIQSSQIKLEQQNNLSSNQDQLFQVYKDQPTQNIANQAVSRQSPLIKPIQITQKKLQTKNISPQSPLLPQTKKKARQQLQIRRIPSELFQSYDQLLLTVNANQKLFGKDNIISPIKLKEKFNPNLTQPKLKQNKNSFDFPNDNRKRPNTIQTNLKKKTVDEELLVSLSVVEGYCQLKTDGSQIFLTKFIINKNTIFFQTFKQIFINSINKVKFIEKDEKEINVKITYEPEPNTKPQNFLIKLLTESSQTYFSQSYEFFSQIVLRKLLLMKLHINQLDQRYEAESPVKSPQSSPLSSPLNLPSILTRKTSDNMDTQSEGQILLQSNLYKKSTFFNSWEKKYFALTSKHLQSYAFSPINGEKQKPSTQLSKTSQIWTRFELTYGYLVIKMWQSKIEKIQIGIPLCDFTNPESKNNWLYGLSKNILWRKHSNKEEKNKTTIVN